MQLFNFSYIFFQGHSQNITYSFPNHWICAEKIYAYQADNSSWVMATRCGVIYFAGKLRGDAAFFKNYAARIDFSDVSG